MQHKKVNFRKDTLCIYTIVLVLGLVMVPEKVEAQRKNTVRVKRSKVVVHKKTRVRPVPRRVAHYRYRSLPRWGRTVRTVGAGYVGIRFGGISYRFHKGIWYRPRGKKFIVARAPFGVRVRVLPIGYRRLLVGTNTYFYYYGTYYKKVTDSNEYQVVKAPIGGKVDALPEGYERLKIGGNEYYKFEDTFYQARIDAANTTNYIVVKPPE